MMQTFTYGPDLNVKAQVEEEKIPSAGFIEPSKNVISNILNFSRNLEIRHSKLVSPIEIIKS